MHIHRLAFLLSALVGMPALADETADGAVDPREAMREAAIEKADLVPPATGVPGEGLPILRAAPAASQAPEADDGKAEGAGRREKANLAEVHRLARAAVHRAAIEEATRAASASLRGPAAQAASARAIGRANGSGGGQVAGPAEANRARLVRESGSPGGKPPWANPGNGGGNGNGNGNNGKGGRP